MNRSIVTFFVICFLIISCTPSHHRLLAFEDLNLINDEGVLVKLPQKFLQNDSIAKLYDKYGYKQKAEKVRSTLEKQKIWIKTAFLEKYNYSKVSFSFEDSIQTDDITYVVDFYTERSWDNSERGDEKEILQLALSKTDSASPLLRSILPRTFDAHSAQYSLNNYRNLVRQLNSYLQKIQKQKAKALNKN